MSVHEGGIAPDFTAESTEGTVTLSNVKANRIVLYFYPKDDTPGCTKEACSFRDHHQQLLDQGAKLFGVSVDSIKRHNNFREKYELPFPLIADPDHKIVTAYGLWGEKKFMGKTYMGVTRATFILDGERRVLKAWPKVKPANHGPEVLEALAQLDES